MHALRVHSYPVWQSSVVRQPTHAPGVVARVSQNGVEPPQSRSSRQPGRQLASSHTEPSGQLASTSHSAAAHLPDGAQVDPTGQSLLSSHALPPPPPPPHAASAAALARI